MTRAAAIDAFLADTGFAAARRVPLAQDASFRRYWRLLGGPCPAVLMDAPPPEDVPAFLRIAAHLDAIGVTVPRILKADPTSGLVLEGDLGDGLLSEPLDRALTAGDGMAAAALLRDAATTLVAIQRATPPHGLPRWDPAAMTAAALGTLFDWWWPARFAAPPPTAARQQIAAALASVLVPLAADSPCFVHRDWFAGNLFPRPGGVAVIDFQGAALGHPAYDLASLLQDARRDIPAEVEEAVLGHYLALRPELPEAAFRAAYAACAAQRHLRVACQWVRLARRDGRPHYLRHGPRTWRLLTRALQHSTLAPLRHALDHWVPEQERANPPDHPA